MNREEITALFDQQAATYDQQWSKLAAINAALRLIADAAVSELPEGAHILCVGSGTGGEILHLAERFPHWRFTAVEPSSLMLEAFRRKAEEQGALSRCALHAGYLDSLPEGAPFDAATSFLVSQFILDREARTGFFQAIAQRLKPGGILLSSDLAGDLSARERQDLIKLWFKVMNQGGVPEEGLARMRQAYERDVAVLPPSVVRDLIASGGFASPTLIFQAGMIHAWAARRA